MNVPEGFKLMPLRATPEMRAAAGHVNSEFLNDIAPINAERYAWPMPSVYEAFVNAAPEVEVVAIARVIATGGPHDTVDRVLCELEELPPVGTKLFAGYDAAGISAVATLKGMGYTYGGGMLWRPPLGQAPRFDMLDALHVKLARRDALLSDIRKSTAGPAHREQISMLLANDPAPHLDFDAAAKKLAECMDYPWEEMPEKGRRNMREHAMAIVREALTGAKVGGQ